MESYGRINQQNSDLNGIGYGRLHKGTNSNGVYAKPYMRCPWGKEGRCYRCH